MLGREEEHDQRETLICQTEGGSAILCTCCGCVELTYGNAILSLDSDDLKSLIGLLTEYEAERSESGSPDDRRYVIRTQNDAAAFIFSRREVRALRRMAIVCQRHVARLRGEGAIGNRPSMKMGAGSLRLVH
jgi:hypothetical protein